MKTKKIVIAVIGCVAGLVLSSCQTKEKKLEDAQENVKEANEDLDEAEREFRNEADIKLRENENEIRMYKDNINTMKVETRANYQRMVDSLERRNEELKIKLKEYKGETNDKWDAFKREFNHDMDELKNSLKDIGKNNVK